MRPRGPGVPHAGLPGVAALAALVTLASCAVGTDFHRPAPPASAAYGSAPSEGETVAAEVAGGERQRFVLGGEIRADWWALFESPKLTALVEQAFKANPGLKQAEAALRQAHELYLAQRTSFLPVLQGGFSGTRAKYPSNTLSTPIVTQNLTYNLYTAQLAVSYAPDVFGATRRAVEAARAGSEGSRYQLAAAYLALSSNVVVTAVQEAALRGQIEATERLVEIGHHLTETVRRQRELGTASALDVLAQETVEAQIAETLPPLRKQLGLTHDALTALLGRLPAEEPAETFRLEDLHLPRELPVSVPAVLVTQRPDVRQAEENLHAASAGVGIAVANLLPQFSIDASAGSTAFGLGSLFTSYTGFWTAGASLTETLFDAGALVHRHRAAEAALDQAAAQYRGAVILACQNVADALRATQADAEALVASAAAERAARGALELARRQYALGTVSVVAVLNAEQNDRQAELVLVQAQANRYADTAALFQSLGGGWWNRPGGIPP